MAQVTERILGELRALTPEQEERAAAMVNRPAVVMRGQVEFSGPLPQGVCTRVSHWDMDDSPEGAADVFAAVESSRRLGCRVWDMTVEGGGALLPEGARLTSDVLVTGAMQGG